MIKSEKRLEYVLIRLYYYTAKVFAVKSFVYLKIVLILGLTFKTLSHMS